MNITMKMAFPVAVDGIKVRFLQERTEHEVPEATANGLIRDGIAIATVDLPQIQTVEEVLKAGYSQEAAAGIIARQQEALEEALKVVPLAHQPKAEKKPKGK